MASERKNVSKPKKAIPVASASAPRLLKVVDFAQSRASELKAFINAVQAFNGTKRTFQTLPRHLRRRTMSHNIHRIPRRLRGSAVREMVGVAPPGKLEKRYRKHKRRPGYLLRDYVRRQRKFKWLETHIWHAKRMKMVNLWGYKIAFQPCDKGTKPLYKAASNIATVHDVSYINVIQLVGQQQQLIQLFKTLQSPFASIDSIGNQMFIKGEREGKTLLYHPNLYPYGAIAPVSFMWNPEANPNGTFQRKVWLWVHPAAYEDLLQVLKSQSKTIENIHVKAFQNDLVRFELIGPKANLILNSVLRLSSQNNQKSTDLWNSLSTLRSTGSIFDGAVLSLSVEDPRQHFPPTKPKVSQMKASKESSDIDISQLHWSTENATSDLWDEEKRAIYSNSRFDSKIKRKPKVTPLLSMNPENKVEENKPATVPILLIQHPAGVSRGFGSGWDIVMPKNWGVPFWISLIYAGARASGLRERYFLSFEQGMPFYPNDYPDTKGGLELSSQQIAEATALWNRTPASKRVNYEKLKVTSPFRPNWTALVRRENVKVVPSNVEKSFYVLRGEEIYRLSQEKSTLNSYKVPANPMQRENLLWAPKSQKIQTEVDSVPREALVRVSIRMLQHGTAENNAMICFPQESDYRAWTTSTTGWVGLEETNVTKLSSKDPIREVIGFVNTGGLSLLRGRGYGIGFCTAESVQKLFTHADQHLFKHRGFVLVRNTTTKIYRPAVLTLCE